MKKLLIILAILLIPQITQAQTLFELDFTDWTLENTNLTIKDTQIRVVDKIRDGVCGTARGGGGIAYLITLSASNECIDNFEDNITHEFIHIYDRQNNLSEQTNFPCINGYCNNKKEQFAYWYVEYYNNKDRIQVFNPQIYNYFNSL